jgi:hypothetical protein
MAWIQPGKQAACDSCDAIRGSQGRDPDGDRCSCGGTFKAVGCRHEGERRQLRESRHWPGVLREQCMACCAILHWTE